MKRLNPQDKTFNQISALPPAWWQELISDKDVYPEIRKDNTIDVYYNGGAIISDLRYRGSCFTGKTHYKYLLPEKSDTVKLFFDCKKDIHPQNESIPLLNLESFDANTLKRIKANISTHYNASSEKGIQARFIKKTGGFIDSEFAYNIGNKTRIDLVWVDTKTKKIIFVELKTMGESRLYRPKDGIADQLSKYCSFLSTNSKELKDYYCRLFEIKKKLNILPAKLKSVTSLTNYSIEEKPLLLIGGCEQEWINTEAKKIDEKIKHVAVGAYYFGKPNDCDLISKTKRNRHIF